MNKMILAIMPTNISEQISSALLDADYRVTKFASTGGLLAVGTTTLMVVFNTDKLDKALEIIRTHTPPAEPTISTHARVTIYVLPVKDFQRV